MVLGSRVHGSLGRAVVVLAALIGSVLLDCSAAARSFHIDYSPDPDSADLLAFDLSILSAEAKVDLKPKQASGGKALGYLSVIEVKPGTPAGLAAKKAEVPVLGENREWESALMDITDPRWSKVVLEELAPALVAKGYDGFFLDTVDSVTRLERADVSRALEFAPALVKLIKALGTEYPDKEIVINRGFRQIEDLGESIDGVLVESVFQTFDPKTKAYRRTTVPERAALATEIGKIKKAGLPIYAVDYVAPSDLELADKTAAQLAELGVEALVTTPALDGVALAPIRRELRKVLVLYGWDETEKRPMWPIDTMTAERLQMPLEWMGYECEYLHVAKEKPLDSLAGHYAGVIFDAELEFPYDKELRYAEWAVRQKREGVKMLFAANFPFATDDAMKEVAEGLDLRGSCQVVNGVDEVEITAIDESVMNYEAKVRPHRTQFLDLRAPTGSRAMLSLRAKMGGRSVADYEPVFTTSWGGAVLDPYATFMASPSHTLSLFDPFAFLAEIWPPGDFPAPDPTTHQGLRVLASHIDGDGFASLSETKRNTTCAEVVRDRILKAFPIPITVSVVEANTRACEKVLKPEARESYEELARTIFQLPNVQAASHTYSHPYIWIEGDPDYQNLYETPRLILHDTESYGDIDYQREIVGSIEYMERELLPAGKKVELLLWSGNCRPPAEALRIVRELGIENMNGGDTIITGRNRCLSAVAPRTMPWRDEKGEELQIFAPNQNEYVYTHDWRGPFYGGFASVIETFEMTETPRRVKPVNIYYHFYSAANLGALRALEKVHQWAMTQPLHATTARQMAAMTRDSRATQLYHNSAGRDWTVVNEGSLRTLRIPASLGLPSILNSEGVVGYNEVGSEVYVHTDGRPKARLVLSTSRPAPPHLRLVSSTAEVTFVSLEPAAASFRTAGVKTVSVVLGGVQAGSSWTVAINGKAGKAVKADQQGFVALEIPKGASVVVTQASLALSSPPRP